MSASLHHGVVQPEFLQLRNAPRGYPFAADPVRKRPGSLKHKDAGSALRHRLAERAAADSTADDCEVVPIYDHNDEPVPVHTCGSSVGAGLAPPGRIAVPVMKYAPG